MKADAFMREIIVSQGVHAGGGMRGGILGRAAGFLVSQQGL